MTRRKKSRKPGPLAPAKKPKDTSASVDSGRGKKKGKGLKPGQRHSSTATKQSASQSGSQQPDPAKAVVARYLWYLLRQLLPSVN